MRKLYTLSELKEVNKEGYDFALEAMREMLIDDFSLVFTIEVKAELSSNVSLSDFIKNICNEDYVVDKVENMEYLFHKSGVCHADFNRLDFD